MMEHVTACLEAYVDEELSPERAQQVATHVAGCASCHAALDELASLKTLLRQSTLPDRFAPATRFVEEVTSQLQPRPGQPSWERALLAGWRAVPFILLGAWTVAQVTLAISGVVVTALQLGLGSDLVAGLLPAPQQSSWLTQILSMSDAGLDELGRIGLQLLRDEGPFSWTSALRLVLFVTFGLSYWSWLGSWWIRHQRRHQIVSRGEETNGSL